MKVPVGNEKQMCSIVSSFSVDEYGNQSKKMHLGNFLGYFPNISSIGIQVRTVDLNLLK